MRVLDIWRYPVKSMAGERLERALLQRDGIEGDRVVQVVGPEGRVLTARVFPRLLGLAAVLGPDGEPRVRGLPWSTPQIAEAVERATLPGAKLVRDDSLERFDVLPLLVATDGAIRAFGRDGRRLRPNIVVAGVDGLAERSWEGRRLRIGGCEIQLADLRQRCVMTTYHPDTLEQDLRVLRDIVQRFDGALALNASVAREGEIRVGDEVVLIRE